MSDKPINEEELAAWYNHNDPPLGNVPHEIVNRMIAEIRRLNEIIRTHDLCHNLHGKVDARAFADGCAAEQRRLYGCAPDADEVARLRLQKGAQP